MNPSQLDELCQKYMPGAVELRHHFHQHPELTWNEHKTAAKIAETLSQISELKVQTGVGDLGVVAILEGAHPGPTVALRADMDALPILERTQLSYRSQCDGVMHACGHDGHIANLIGSAWMLADMRDKLHGRVKFIFQPAEEGGAGALRMCNDGVLEDVDVIFGLHAWPEAPQNTIWLKDGALLASNSEIDVKVSGQGTHAAMPHLGTDQVLAACRMIEALQSVVSRSIAPSDAVALSITRIHGGDATNIIPADVSFSGTLRTLDESVRQHCYQRIEAVIQGIAQSMNVSADVKLKPIYPETVNHAQAVAFVETVAKDLLGAEGVRRIEHASMGAEDFSFYLQRIPGAFFFLGMAVDTSKRAIPLHHPEFNFNDHSLSTGMKLFTELALRFGKDSAVIRS